MKKLFNALFVITLLFGMTLNVHADTGGENEPVLVKKLDKNNKNMGTENFNFVIDMQHKYTGIISGGTEFTLPSLFANDKFTITVNDDETEGSIPLNLGDFKTVGRYQYVIKEEPGSLPGMTYDKNEYILVILVTLDDELNFVHTVGIVSGDGKEEELIVAYNEFNAEDLVIEKKLKGNYTDPNDEFEVTVELTPKDGLVFTDNQKNLINIEGLGEEAEIELKDNVITITFMISENKGELSILNIPFGVEYLVSEEVHSGYTINNSETEGLVGEINENNKVVITNEREMDVETGVNLDNLPYILTLGVAVVGIAYLSVRKRRTH